MRDVPFGMRSSRLAIARRFECVRRDARTVEFLRVRYAVESRGERYFRAACSRLVVLDVEYAKTPIKFKLSAGEYRRALGSARLTLVSA